jgi:hypothetical protein
LSKSKFIKRRALHIVLLVIIAFNAYSGIFISQQSGNWFDNNTWEQDSTFIPALRSITNGDTVIIKSGHTVTIFANGTDYGSAAEPILYIQVEGILTFKTGRKLIMPCGSGVKVLGGSIVVPGGGGGNSNVIEICNTVLWKAGDGTLPGPVDLGTTPTFPLPVVWISLTASEHSDGIYINWIVSESSNASVYFIQRTGDLEVWNIIGSVEGTRNTNQNYIDNTYPNGRLYYRVKAEDEDGKISYSPIATINIGLSGEIKIYPNPTSNYLFVEGNSIENEEINIHNNAGRNFQVKSSMDQLILKIDVTSLDPGSYFLSLGKDHKERSFHFIVK